MGEGASSNDVGVLYCCAEPNIHMNGVTVPSAYAVRSSPDYVWGAGNAAIQLPTVQWAIGPDAAFHWLGLGLLPYKDTFISNATSTQKSGRSWTDDQKMWPSFSGFHETGAQTHALMSLLSMAHVTFGDAVGETNKTLIMQLIRKDGMLLKADRPATAIDGQFQAMMFGSWPGSGSSGGGGDPNGAGSLYTKTCDPRGDPAQQFTYTCNTKSHQSHYCTLTSGIEAAEKSANDAVADADADADEGCLSIVNCSSAGVGSEVRFVPTKEGDCGANVGLNLSRSSTTMSAADQTQMQAQAHGKDSSGASTCRGNSQHWLLVENDQGPGSSAQSALQSGYYNSSSGKQLCLEPRNGGVRLAECNPDIAPQGWYLRTDVALKGKPFIIATTEHDDAMCLTVRSSGNKAEQRESNGAFTFASKEEAAALADEVFPRHDSSDVYQLSDQYRAAYAQSVGLMRTIERRQKERKRAQKHKQEEQEQEQEQHEHVGGKGVPTCDKDGLGAPQGPLGELYTTHTSVSGMVWRYVVGVQLVTNYTVTRLDLALGADGPSTKHVTYVYDEGVPGFKPTTASDLHSVPPATPAAAAAAAAAEQALQQQAGGSVLTLHANTEELCNSAPDFGIKTRCFPFQLHAVAPVADNGWVLTGETGKFLPISTQRIAAITTLPSGGFKVALLGAPGEVVEMGAADIANGKAPTYGTATIGSDGTAILTLA